MTTHDHIDVAGYADVIKKISVVSNNKKRLDAKNHLSSCDKNDRWQNVYFDLPNTFAEDENVDIVAYFLKFGLLKAAL